MNRCADAAVEVVVVGSTVEGVGPLVAVDGVVARAAANVVVARAALNRVNAISGSQIEAVIAIAAAVLFLTTSSPWALIR